MPKMLRKITEFQLENSYKRVTKGNRITGTNELLITTTDGVTWLFFIQGSPIPVLYQSYIKPISPQRSRHLSFPQNRHIRQVRSIRSFSAKWHGCSRTIFDNVSWYSRQGEIATPKRTALRIRSRWDLLYWWRRRESNSEGNRLIFKVLLSIGMGRAPNSDLFRQTWGHK